MRYLAGAGLESREEARRARLRVDGLVMEDII
jgi:hypothetical protein